MSHFHELYPSPQFSVFGSGASPSVQERASRITRPSPSDQIIVALNRIDCPPSIYSACSPIKCNLSLVCLDGVTDPRNIGSIIRTAASFEFNGLVVKERSFPSKSKLLYKSASGSIEHINIFKVSNLNTALSFLKKNNFWVSAFDSKVENNFTKHNWSGKNVLLFGSEGQGLREKTLSKADFKFKIKISNKIESLNISNTVSIVCHFIKNQMN